MSFAIREITKTHEKPASTRSMTPSERRALPNDLGVLKAQRRGPLFYSSSPVASNPQLHKRKSSALHEEGVDLARPAERLVVVLGLLLQLVRLRRTCGGIGRRMVSTKRLPGYYNKTAHICRTIQKAAKRLPSYYNCRAHGPRKALAAFPLLGACQSCGALRNAAAARLTTFCRSFTSSSVVRNAAPRPPPRKRTLRLPTLRLLRV